MDAFPLQTVMEGIHGLTTIFMTGLIWFVQRVHYPLMADVGDVGFEAYESRHQKRTGQVVMPAMLLELISGVGLFVLAIPGGHTAFWGINGIMLLGIWGSTIVLQVPLHRRLSQGYDPKAISQLVATNWMRTLLWSGRSLLLIGGWGWSAYA